MAQGEVLGGDRVVTFRELENQLADIRVLLRNGENRELSNGERHLIDSFLWTRLIPLAGASGLLGVILGAALTYGFSGNKAQAVADAFQTSVNGVVEAAKKVDQAEKAAELAKTDAESAAGKAEEAQRKSEESKRKADETAAKLATFLGADGPEQIAAELVKPGELRERLISVVRESAAEDITKLGARVETLKAQSDKVPEIETRLTAVADHAVIKFLTNPQKAGVRPTKYLYPHRALNPGELTGTHSEYLYIVDMHVGGYLSVAEDVTCDTLYFEDQNKGPGNFKLDGTATE